MTQPEDAISQTSESDQAADALVGLLNLLVDLRVVDPPPRSVAAESGDITEVSKSVSHSLESLGVGCGVWGVGNANENDCKSDRHSHHSSPEVEQVTANPIDSFISPGHSCPTALPLQSIHASGREKFSESPSIEDEIVALERLQSLLVEPELAEFRPQVQTLEQKLSHLEHQIYDPAELMKLLLPRIAELLSCKIAESQEEIVEAIAPIIDRIIENRADQDKAAMAAALAPIISGAISRQTAKSPQEVANAIAPMMGKAIQEQIRLERDAMVDALYPVIGSTIAKYMAEAIQSINQKIETTFSVEGIQRKIRAKLQGVSEAELILKESMPFTIQAVFLIHKASGLVISEVQREGNPLESDMIAGMLTAIRSFANDCIAQSGAVSELDAIDYGNSKILLEVAGYCYLAVVIQGEPSRRFIATLRHTLSTLIQQHGQAIEAFEGDPETVPTAINPLLQTLRDADLPANSKGKQPPVVLVGVLMVVGAIATIWGINHYQNYIDQQIQTDTANALAAAPELAVYRLKTEVHRGTLKLTGQVPNQGLRQKAEQIAQAIAPHQRLENRIQAVDVPADPTLAAAEVKRLTTTLNQTEGTAIAAHYAHEKVVVTGTVNNIAHARAITQAFERVPGVRLVSNTVQIQPLKIDVRFYFGVASSWLESKDLGYKLRLVKRFLSQHPEKSVRIVGYSHPISSPAETRALALQRARSVRDALIRQGVQPSRLSVTGLTRSPTGVSLDQPAWLNRCVEVIPVGRIKDEG